MLSKHTQVILIHLLLALTMRVGQAADLMQNTLYPETIMRLTMDHSAQIKAAKYKLESARYNFKLFESEYTTFTPLNMSSDVQGNQDREFESETSLGVRKEYFDGSSVDAALGNSASWGGALTEERSQFIKTEIQFPMFSSNRKLNRIIKRTFEENELYSAQLDYVNTIRRTIENALETYYDYVPRAKTLARMRQYKQQLVELKNNPTLQQRETDQQQLEDEINALTSQIQGWEIEVESLLIEMKRWIGADNLDQFSVRSVDLDFDTPGYSGEYYVVASYDEILKKAILNDTELKVLDLIRENAIEKKKLAEKGKWDIFLSLGGRYIFKDQVGGRDQDPFYTAGTGIEIRRFDSAIIKNTIYKAQADIKQVEMTMEDRRLEMASDITRKKATLLTKQEQVLSSRVSLASRQQIHDLKLANFIQGTETVDNYLQAFRSLVSTMETSLSYENRYLDTLRDFDYICGEYFQFLGIDAY